jgi:hypothetical protein
LPAFFSRMGSPISAIAYPPCTSMTKQLILVACQTGAKKNAHGAEFRAVRFRFRLPEALNPKRHSRSRRSRISVAVACLPRRLAAEQPSTCSPWSKQIRGAGSQELLVAGIAGRSQNDIEVAGACLYPA